MHASSRHSSSTFGASLATFSVYAGEVLVGNSMLERGDPLMGVAFGALTPTGALARADC